MAKHVYKVFHPASKSLQLANCSKGKHVSKVLHPASKSLQLANCSKGKHVSKVLHPASKSMQRANCSKWQNTYPKSFILHQNPCKGQIVQNGKTRIQSLSSYIQIHAKGKLFKRQNASTKPSTRVEKQHARREAVERGGQYTHGKTGHGTLNWKESEARGGPTRLVAITTGRVASG
ncbi:hypothetical protein KM043_005574 [Ampulex compressa]|nr:hypothetical protein KM043_005574 [Ampulex compressa]